MPEFATRAPAARLRGRPLLDKRARRGWLAAMQPTPLVFLEGPWRLAMGLHALEIADWLWIDDRWAIETAERRRLAAQRRDLVYAALPGSEEACRELLEVVVDWLVRFAPDRFAPARESSVLWVLGERIDLEDDEPLLVAGRLVQEDLLLLAADGSGTYRLVAGHLCFPLHWKLGDKLGKSVGEIHEPVPDFARRLGGPTDRFFQALDVARPVWRANWSLTSTPELCLPDRSDRASTLASERAGERLWLRVERQTLRRLPRTKAIVFTVKTRVVRLDEATRDPAVAAALAARIREMPEAMAAYKGILPIRTPLLAWLDARAVGAQELAATRR